MIVFNMQYEHCPRLLTFKIGIEVYSDVFFMVQPQSIFRKPCPRKKELLDDIILYC